MEVSNVNKHMNLVSKINDEVNNYGYPFVNETLIVEIVIYMIEESTFVGKKKKSKNVMCL